MFQFRDTGSEGQVAGFPSFEGGFMLSPRFAVWIIPLNMVLDAGVVSAQDYPHKPIRIVTSAPGGGSDFMARQIAQGLTANLGQQVIVENRSSGVIQGE